LNASNTLEKKKIKVKYITKEELRKAKQQLVKAELTKREALKRVGITIRVVERERKKSIRV